MRNFECSRHFPGILIRSAHCSVFIVFLLGTRYKGLFDVAWFSSAMAHHLTSEFEVALAPGARVIMETVRFVLALKEAQTMAFNEKLVEQADAAGCRADGDQTKDDNNLFFTKR